MNHQPTTHPSAGAGYCGVCHEVVRLGETCCGEYVGWINPDGDRIGWHDYQEYVEAVGGGRMLDARLHGSPIPDWVLELPSELFLDAVFEADASELIRRAHDEGWPAGTLGQELRRLMDLRRRY